MATIVCYGDSNTHGMDASSQTRLPRDVRWPGVLRARSGPEHDVIEEGLNGRTTSLDDPTSPGRNGASSIEACLWSHEPVDLVIVMLGTNDLKARFGCDGPMIAQGVSLVVGLARRTLAGPEGTPPRILLVAPPPLGPVTRLSELWGFGAAIETSRELARLYELVAANAGCAFLDAGRHVSAAAADGVHLDAEGHRRLGGAMAGVVRSLLG
jgi:lysophospholipase L1-like esterase